MLPRHQRLTDSRDFKRVYQKGSFFAYNPISVNWLANKTSQTRIGFVVGKKVSSKATERNKIKRRLREAAKGIYSEISSGYDVIFIIKGQAKNLDFARILEAVKGASKKIGIKSEKNYHKSH